nr:uncharacterized protein LOC121121896 isoform X2 [Lepeophtheirus salmonis]
MINYLLIVSLMCIVSTGASWNLRSESKEKSTLQKVTEDKRHLKEDLQFKTREEIEKMTPLELAYAFFSNHNYNRDDGLDGSEIFKALHHKHAHEDERYLHGHITSDAKDKEFQNTVGMNQLATT